MLHTRFVIPLLLIAGVSTAAYLQLRPPGVRLARAESGQVIEVVYATGTVRPDTETRAAPEVSGRIVALLADEGELVRAGQPLARLDAAEAVIRLREAERKLETARARLRQAAAPTDPFTVGQLRAQLRAAEARTAAARERVTTAGDRIETAASSARAAEAAVEGARARVRSLRSTARAVLDEVEAARERVATAEAEIAQARAGADAARDLYDRRQALLREGAIAERLVTEARTAQQSAEAGLRAATARAEAARRALAGVRASADAAQAQAEDAEAGEKAAGESAAAARSQATEARNAPEELRRQVDAHRQDVEAIRSQVAQAVRGRQRVDIDVVRTEVGTQEAAVAQARQELSRYTLLSPVSGRITSRPVDPGDYIPAGGRLFTIASEQRVYVQADVDEADIGQVRQGSQARFQVDAQPGKTYTGRVALIGRAADRGTKTYPVEIRGIDTAAGLRIGMTADVNIRGRVTDGAVLVPSAALQTEADHTIAWVIDSQERARRRIVRFKAKDAQSVQVIQGIYAGEQVVLDPPGGLQDGRAVRVAR